ncbi:hypothetical protein ASG22_05610 [Chryseobacterium sp. Leaf405]|uniref:hypothetical protein n=1 Tax=Chryseobacterium sp. Leaf405 TaxID=1736367 RepID=UPI0006F994F1|nr:hypothetical protein [Chryseobacterium sp. Leaf405]KQT26146.1 hypothetical protein ASG22_05610 [Chryseobacterium sp. Leaf405]
MKQYHLSYDTKEKREKILEVIFEHTEVRKVESFCESTLILHFEKSQPNLFNTLSNNLGKNFYFVVSLVTQIKDPSDNSIKNIIKYKPVPNLNDNLQIELERFKK